MQVESNGVKQMDWSKTGNVDCRKTIYLEPINQNAVHMSFWETLRLWANTSGVTEQFRALSNSANRAP